MYLNAEGGSGGGGAAGWIKLIGGAITSVADYGKSTNDLKTEQEKTKQTMYNKLFGSDNKTNWLPIVAVTGILVIGGIVMYLSLKSRSQA